MLSVYIEGIDGRQPAVYARQDGFEPAPSDCPIDWEQSPEADEIRAWIGENLPLDRVARVTLFFTYREGQAWFDTLPATHHFNVIGTEAGYASPPPLRRCTRCAGRYPVDHFTDESVWCDECVEDHARVQCEVAEHGRRFGVEIEFILSDEGGYERCGDCDCEECCETGNAVPSDVIADALRYAGIECYDEGYTHEVFEDGWKIVSDSSVDGGWELVSPPLRWAQRDQVEAVCQVLAELGASVDSQCGLHVHHEVKDLDLASFKRLYRNWDDWQHYTDSLVSPSRRDGRWCQHLEERDIEAVESMETLSELSECYIDRYHALNVTCYPTYGTVEIRQHQGTINAAKILAWVAYGQAIVEASTHADATVWPSGLEGFLDWLPFREDECEQLSMMPNNDGAREYLKRRANRLAGNHA